MSTGANPLEAPTVFQYRSLLHFLEIHEPATSVLPAAWSA